MKLTHTLIAAGTCLLPLVTWAQGKAPAKIVPKPPLVHWTFDLEGENVRDAVGNCHGKLESVSGIASQRPGIFGNALYFNASQSRVRVPYDGRLSLRNNFTIEYVVKPFRKDGFMTIFWQGDRTVSPEKISYFVDLRDGRPELKTKDAQGRWLVYSTPTALAENEWHHVVISYQSGNVEIITDGIPRKVGASENGKQNKDLLTNACDVILGDGANHSGPAYSFCGLIDDIAIYPGREHGMLTDDYVQRWQTLRANVRQRELAFVREQAAKREEERQREIREYASLFPRHTSRSDAPFIATVFPASERIDGTNDFFRRIRSFSRTANLAAARREYEGFQIILMAPGTGVETQVTASVTDLIHSAGESRIPASDISLGRVERTTTTEPDIAVPFVGEIPDVIHPDGKPVNVRPGDFGGLFCRIHTGNALPGHYRGTLTLTAGTYSERIEINLEVYDFTLPLRPSLKTAFCFFESYYKRWYGLKTLTDPQREKIYEFLLDYRLSPCNIYSGEAPFPPTRFLEKYRDRINFFTVGKLRGKTLEELRKSAAERSKLINRLRAMGLEKSMYFYGFDELSMNMKNLAKAQSISAALREACPGLKLMQTSTPIPEIQPLFDTWVPLFHAFGNANAALIEAMRKRGDEIWWYAADAPQHPYPNFFLDYPVFDCRVIGTLSHRQNVEGVLYWCINREWQTNLDIRKQWPDADWKAHIYHAHNGKRKYKNGMGNLVYPGTDGSLLPSLRLENLRDGLEDYEYLHALEEAVKKLETDTSPAAKALLPEARALLTVPKEAITGLKAWSHDPRHLLAYRNRVGKFLGRLSRLDN